MAPETWDKDGMLMALTLRKVKFAAPTRFGKLTSRSIPLAENDNSSVMFFRSLTLIVVR